MKKAFPTTEKAHINFNIWEWLGLEKPTLAEFVFINLVGFCFFFTFFTLMILFY
jgi:hypothetical protein